MLNAISLGAGVQSSTMALMAAAGEIEPMPDCGIFSDTQAEPLAVYRWLDWLEKQLPFPVYRVTAGNLTKTIGSKRPHGQFRIVPIPAFVKNPTGEMGGLINRSCTRDFKIDPIRRKVRELVGLTRKRSPKTPVVTQWIGISLDEAHRMKPSREPWQEMRWPLIELRITRTDCLQWMRQHGFPEPPKSSCIYCPFHSDQQWRNLTAEERESANLVDESLRSHPSGEYRTKGVLFLHRSGKPLREIDFKKEAGLFDGFGNECEGMCGV
jgi:hypothetical protein